MNVDSYGLRRGGQIKLCFLNGKGRQAVIEIKPCLPCGERQEKDDFLAASGKERPQAVTIDITGYVYAAVILVSGKKHSFCASLCPAKQQHQLLPSL